MGCSEMADDLWTEILCLLPVKDVVAMRAVNRFFVGLIDSEVFSNSYNLSRKQPPNSDDAVVVSLTMEYCYGERVFEYPVRPAQCRIGQRKGLDIGIDMVKYNTNLTSKYSPFCDVAGCVDGLVLLKARASGSGGSKGIEDVGMLWNPSIRKYRPLPLPSPYSTTSFSDLQLGLGYDPSTKDYKVLAIFNLMHRGEGDDNLQGWGVWVYSVLHTRSWTPVLNSGLSTYDHCFSYWIMSRPTSFNGSLFWIETAWGKTSYEQCLTRFDLATNQFRYGSMPDYELFTLDRDEIPEWCEQTLTTIGPNLAVAKSDMLSGFSIWILDDIDAMTWTRLHVSSPAQASGLYSHYWIKRVSLRPAKYKRHHSVRRLETAGLYVESLLLLH